MHFCNVPVHSVQELIFELKAIFVKLKENSFLFTLLYIYQHSKLLASITNPFFSNLFPLSFLLARRREIRDLARRPKICLKTSLTYF